jgi:hypothetical protein
MSERWFDHIGLLLWVALAVTITLALMEYLLVR